MRMQKRAAHELAIKKAIVVTQWTLGRFCFYEVFILMITIAIDVCYEVKSGNIRFSNHYSEGFE